MIKNGAFPRKCFLESYLQVPVVLNVKVLDIALEIATMSMGSRNYGNICLAVCVPSISKACAKAEPYFWFNMHGNYMIQ